MDAYYDPKDLERFQEIGKDTLDRHGLPLARGETRTLQVNVGYRCALACRHCHLAANPAGAGFTCGGEIAA